MKTPVLFFVFCRPDTTRRVFEAIRQARPERLFLAQDALGPKTSNADLIRRHGEVKQILQGVDWPCEVKTFFEHENQGMVPGANAAISWFFENVEQGIILEDDCLPEPSFFTFCEELLERYKDDKRVGMISGDNFQDGNKRGEGTYYFSKIHHIWGWATWRRVWVGLDTKMRDFPKFISAGRMAEVSKDPLIRFRLGRVYRKVFEGREASWDMPFAFRIWNEGGVCIAPNINLVSNIGYGTEDARNCQDESCKFANMKTFPVGKMVHPAKMEVDWAADRYEFYAMNWTLVSGRIKRLLRIKS